MRIREIEGVAELKVAFTTSLRQNGTGARKPQVAQTGKLLVEIRDLTVTFEAPGNAGEKAIDGVSLAIREGEFIALLGESGSGKSTLGRSILGILPANARVIGGSITYRGRDMLGASERDLEQVRGAQIAMVFQQPGMALNPYMRAAGQVAEVIRAHSPLPRARCRDEARRVLEIVFESDLDRICNAYPHELSGGEKQRLSIAQAIACGPRLIVADEPTTALDSVVQASLIRLFGRINEIGGAAVLFLTHNPAILWNRADRAIVLRRGRLVEDGDLSDVYSYPRDEYTADLFGRSVA
jgi:ABC-type glutathione transport system ATPase component